MNFSRYGSARQWMRTVSPAARSSHGTSPRDPSASPGPTSYALPEPVCSQASAASAPGDEPGVGPGVEVPDAGVDAVVADGPVLAGSDVRRAVGSAVRSGDPLGELATPATVGTGEPAGPTATRAGSARYMTIDVTTDA